MKPVIWSIKEIIKILKTRQENEFDGNFVVTGNRGDGKSTLINKIFLRIGGFKPFVHQCYDREEVVKLLKSQTYGICWDDEAINSSYKRDYQKRGQKDLIKILTAYRDNYNIYASAIPNFFSLDKDLRDLFFIHFQIVERGIAVIHMPNQGRLYSQDRWDIAYNSKIEEGWSKKLKKDPNFKPPYHLLTTFRGYLYFGPLTKAQKERYKEVKRIKREKSFATPGEKTEKQLSSTEKIYNLLKDGKLSKDGLLQICQLEGKKYSSITSILNRMLTDNGESKTVKDFLQQPKKTGFHSKTQAEINQIVPDI